MNLILIGKKYFAIEGLLVWVNLEINCYPKSKPLLGLIFNQTFSSCQLFLMSKDSLMRQQNIQIQSPKLGDFQGEIVGLTPLKKNSLFSKLRIEKKFT